jgi:hypothetical protein
MWYVVGAIVLAVITVFLMPKPPPGPKPSTVSDVRVPITEEGEEVGAVYGTVWITAPQIVWYGDFSSKAIKSEGGKK